MIDWYWSMFGVTGGMADNGWFLRRSGLRLFETDVEHVYDIESVRLSIWEPLWCRLILCGIVADVTKIPMEIRSVMFRKLILVRKESSGCATVHRGWVLSLCSSWHDTLCPAVPYCLRRSAQVLGVGSSMLTNFPNPRARARPGYGRNLKYSELLDSIASWAKKASGRFNYESMVLEGKTRTPLVWIALIEGWFRLIYLYLPDLIPDTPTPLNFQEFGSFRPTRGCQ